MANNWQINAIVGLDGTQSRNQLNSDIKGLARNLDKLKLYTEIDKNQVTQLQHQLKNLQVQLNNVTVSDAVINGLVAKINAGLQNVNISNVNIDNIGNQARQTGEKIAQQINQGINSVVQKGSFEKIFTPDKNGINGVAKDAEKYFKTLSNTVSVEERLGNKNNLEGFTVTLKNAEGVVEQLRYKYQELKNDAGEVTSRWFEYSGGSINDNGVIKQMNAISAKADSLQTKLDKLKANYSDVNASRPIKDSGNISALSQQYDKVTQAIENVRSADNATFSSMVSNAQREITTLESMVSQFRNAENVATQMKSVDISSGIAQAQERLAKLKANSSGFEQMTNTIRNLDIAIEGVGDKSSLDKFINDLRTAETQLSRVKAESKQLEQLNKIQLSTDVTKLETDYKKFGMVSQEVETNLKELKSAHEAVINAKGTDRLASEIERYDVALDKAKFSLKELTTTQVSMSQRANQMHTMKDWMDKNTKATKLCGEQVKQLIAECETCDAVRFDGIKREFKGIQDTARTAGKLGLSFFDGIKEQVSKFTQWFGITSVISSGVRAIKDMVVNVKELDDSLLELSKVSDLSANGLAKITDEAYKLGETVGKTGRQVIDAVTEFKRAGYTLNDSMDMAEAALVMTNVAEGITDTADAAGTLISVLKGYNMAESQAMSIVDMLNSTSNQSPIGFDELAEGLERTAGTMAQSGTTIQETIGLITAGYAQLRNVEKVSTSLITLSARLRGVNEDGEEIDGLSAELEESFGKIGVAIEDADGNLRSIYQIAQDYAKVMPTLTSEQKQYYAELAAGKRNVTTWNAITQQFIDAEKATAQAVDSVGSASEENQKYLDSISGKVSQFNSAVEQLSSTIVDSDLVKFFVDLGTMGVNAIDGLINALTPLGTIGLIGGSILSKNGIG